MLKQGVLRKAKHDGRKDEGGRKEDSHNYMSDMITCYGHSYSRENRKRFGRADGVYQWQLRVQEEISRNTAQEIIEKIETHDMKREARTSEKSENKPYQKIKRSIMDNKINKYTNKKYSPGNHGHSARNKLPLQNMRKVRIGDLQSQKEVETKSR